jgi:predicted Fe-Mo cluster-binding NifX family protein
LLLEHPDVVLTGANQDYGAAREQIIQHQPDVIVIEKIGEDQPSEIYEILENSPWDVDVIELSLMDNLLSVYHHEQREVSQAQELLNLVLKSGSDRV